MPEQLIHIIRSRSPLDKSSLRVILRLPKLPQFLLPLVAPVEEDGNPICQVEGNGTDGSNHIVGCRVNADQDGQGAGDEDRPDRGT